MIRKGKGDGGPSRRVRPGKRGSPRGLSRRDGQGSFSPKSALLSTWGNVNCLGQKGLESFRLCKWNGTKRRAAMWNTGVPGRLMDRRLEKVPGRRVYSNPEVATLYRRRRAIKLTRGMQRPSDWGWIAMGSFSTIAVPATQPEYPPPCAEHRPASRSRIEARTYHKNSPGKYKPSG